VRLRRGRGRQAFVCLARVEREAFAGFLVGVSRVRGRTGAAPRALGSVLEK